MLDPPTLRTNTPDHLAETTKPTMAAMTGFRALDPRDESDVVHAFAATVGTLVVDTEETLCAERVSHGDGGEH